MHTYIEIFGKEVMKIVLDILYFKDAIANYDDTERLKKALIKQGIIKRSTKIIQFSSWMNYLKTETTIRFRNGKGQEIGRMTLTNEDLKQIEKDLW